jgi:hypothetical protein
VAYVFNHTAAKDDDPAKSRQFMRQVGAAGSATEHVVPERLFGNPALASGDPSQPEGVSAVRILSVAAAQGKKIYTLSASNTAMHAAILQNLQIGAVLGAFAAPLYGWVFWLLGFQADGGIRAALTHCNRSS